MIGVNPIYIFAIVGMKNLGFFVKFYGAAI